VEGQLGVEMKGVDRAIDVARQAGADEVWLLTSSQVDDYTGCDRVVSEIPLADTPAVYRSCDVLLKLSNVEGMYGPPLEMMHCGGTAVTYDVSGFDEYVENGRNALVVPTGDEGSAVEALTRLREPGLLASLEEGALATAAGWPSWEYSSKEFLRAVTAISRRTPDPRLVEQMMMAEGAGPLHRTVTLREAT
jgi:glycosyltransferase involved in cell wall biosynthesis